MDATRPHAANGSSAASELAAFFPGYFAFVMATGIVSVAAHFEERERIALGLFGLNLVAHGVLWGLTLILYRWMFFTISPEDLSPDYWINMGALAITTLAGALLSKAGSLWSLLQRLAPFLTGSMLLFWAAATWWIPLLLMLGWWRHWRGRGQNLRWQELSARPAGPKLQPWREGTFRGPR